MLMIARRIALDRPLADFHRFVLAPTFVERNPTDDRRMTFQRSDHAVEFQHELLMLFRRPLGIDRIGLQPCPLAARLCCRHRR